MSKTAFDTLYKQTSSGKVQQWTISVTKNQVIKVYGLVDGKLQTTSDLVKEGKNLGRSNGTTPETQAVAQATQEFEGKLKEGYVRDVKVAASTKNTLKAIKPMLAHPIEKQMKHVVFPAVAQPKLDGLRCIARLRNGNISLFSRTQKEYITVPHIAAELESLLRRHKDIDLDGELYNHKYKKDFNQIVSLIRRDELHPKYTLAQYHIYDIAAPGAYLSRTKELSTLLTGATYCFQVETVPINSYDELLQYQTTCIEAGYEGCMYRNLSGEYENKRSSNLLKVKTFQDAEFEIVGVVEGKGKLMGKVGKFVCLLPDGRTFGAKPMGNMELIEQYWKDQKECVGKQATVKFQNYTPEGVPRFPVLKCIRNYE